DGVGGARTGNCDQGRSGAEKKALDVHFLTSSQNRVRRSQKPSSQGIFSFYFRWIGKKAFSGALFAKTVCSRKPCPIRS
ncbi:hypothetical protein, partial [Mesorhizobium ciceri]